MTWGVLAETEEELQRRVVEWQEAIKRKGLKIKEKITEIIMRTREGRVDAEIYDRKKYRLKQVDTK